MKKVTLIAVIIFILVYGVLYMRNIFVSLNSQLSVLATRPLTKSDINPPNINLNELIINSNEMDPDSFTFAEIAKHNSRNDCYLVINNNVYDVSTYIDYHPGGARIIISRCGKEVTGIFAKIHSNRAWDLLKKYKIGNIYLNKIDNTPQILEAIAKALKKANPGADIIKVRPKINFYIVKIIYNNKLYEIHLNNNGQIVKEEIEDDEFNWSLWENDNDDI